MINDKNIKSITIEKQNDHFSISWIYINPVTDEDNYGKNVVVSGGRCTVDDTYQAIAHLCDPSMNFKKLRVVAIQLHSPDLDPDWEYISEYAKKNNLSRQTIYNYIKSGKLETLKFEDLTFVRPK